MFKTKEKSGVTLIALVITIIVLLILASVSIAMLTGNNGILTQAKLAKENTAAAKEDEENKLANNNKYINEQLGNAVPGKVVTETKKDNYVDSNGDKATIPADFMVDETENTISKGLVVHGPDKVNGDNGSEFVWIPVPDINNMMQCSTADGNCNIQLNGSTLKCLTHDNVEIVGKLYSTEIGKDSIDANANSTYSEDRGLREPALVATYDDNATYNNNVITLTNIKKDYLEMATSVAKYGGFYVGRYETSLSNATQSEAKDGKVQSKSGVMPTSSENEATSTWYGLYRAHYKTYVGNSNSVESNMIWGSQYDRIINWVKEGTDTVEKAKLTNTELGNHSLITKVTGNNDDSINNIEDLGGNIREWTMEAYNTDIRISRGGDYYVKHSPSSRNIFDYPNSITSGNGSRIVLYIK